MQSKFKVVIAGVEEILPEVARLSENKIHHILQPKHAWGRLVKCEKDWNAVSRIISKVIREGIEDSHGTIGRIMRLEINGELVEVTFRRVDNTIKVSNAWINTVLKKT